MTIKQYKDLKIGDEVCSADDINKEIIGTITWIGTAKQLYETGELGQSIVDEWEMDVEEIDELFDIVLVDCKDGFGEICYNYNNDPCGCVCYK